MPAYPNEPAGRDLGGACILVIDDENSVRRIVRRMLDEYNCRVVEALDGFDGLAVVEREPGIDLVLTDLSMPRMGGLALVQTVSRRFPDLPVVVMSGNSAAMSAAPHVPILRKPFSADELLGTLSEQLSRRRRSSEPALAAGPQRRSEPRSTYRSPPR